MYGVVILGILALAFTCAVIMGFNQLKNAINVIDASLDFLDATKRIIFVPLVHFVLQIVVIVVWCFCFACLISMNDIKPDPIIPQMKTFEQDN
jgi:hypothetical protein